MKILQLDPTFLCGWGFQQGDELFEPNTIATAKQKILFIKKPKAPVKSGCILENLKQAVMLASGKRTVADGKDAVRL